MDTVMSIALAVPGRTASAWDDAAQRAFGWFTAVEAVCSRFDPASEAARLATRYGRPQRVAMAGPRRSEPFLRELALRDGAVATSGERARGPHILATGDSQSVPASVSVLAPKAALADALSTAAFAAGTTRGLALLERTDDVEGLLVSRSGRVITTTGLPPDARGRW